LAMRDFKVSLLWPVDGTAMNKISARAIT
jgi:hypothetical protein